MNIEFLPFHASDFTTFINWCTNENVTRQLDGLHLIYPVTAEKLANDLANPDLHLFSVWKEDQLIGHAAIRELDEDTAEICRVIIADPNFRGQGIGREMVERVLDIANHNLKKHRVIAHLYEWNTDGIRCYSSAGFKRIPELDQDHLIDNENWLSLGFECHFTAI